MRLRLNSMKAAVLLSVCLSWLPWIAWASPVTDLLEEYKSLGAANFDASAGKEMWTKSFIDSGTGQKRSCPTCHTDNLRNAGKHVRTKKAIDPMAPSVNPERLTDTKKIKKWLKRNCKWTLGRECTPQEKGNVLVYLKDL